MICPSGHESAATDYCDVCGTALSPAPTSDAASAAPAHDAPEASAESPAVTPAASGSVGTSSSDCPHCGAGNLPDALFCEACGYDFTTGAVPASERVEALPTPAELAPPIPASDMSAEAANPAPENPEAWVAEVWIDPQWYASQSSPDPLPSAGPPRVVPLRHTSLLIGRASQSRGINPDVDCGVDNGVSRRHAQLTTDGSRWWIEDLDSSNGTFVSDVVGELPTTEIARRTKVELGPDTRIFLGSWTRVVVRRADPGEL
mgnify:CR=1 FL=1